MSLQNVLRGLAGHTHELTGQSYGLYSSELMQVQVIFCE